MPVAPRSIHVEEDWYEVVFRPMARFMKSEVDEDATELAQRVIEGAVVYVGRTFGGEELIQKVLIPIHGPGSSERAMELAWSIQCLVDQEPQWQCPVFVPFQDGP